jgi:hypothetical protein
LDGCPIARTPSGGYHVYLRSVEPPGRNTKLAVSAQPVRAGSHLLVETRGEGGYVVAPGSPVECHRTRRPYAWHLAGWRTVEHDRLHSDTVLALFSAARELQSRAVQPAETVIRPAAHGHTRYGRSALRNLVAELDDAAVGTRNSTLNRAAYRVGRLAKSGQLDVVTAASALHAAALKVGLLEPEIVKTIRSGLRAGLSRLPEAKR